MRILWFSNTPSCYASMSTDAKKRGGGWIESAERALSSSVDVDLAVCFVSEGDSEKLERQGVVYYPVRNPNDSSIWIRVKKAWHAFIGKYDYAVEESTWKYHIAAYMDVVKDFKPDIIHVWGTEKYFGLIAKYTEVPVVLHIQGLLNPYYSVLLPPAVSWSEFEGSCLNLKRWFDNRMYHYTWEMACHREQEIVSGLKYYMGRTEWDKRVSSIMNPQSEYMYCGEFLREEFYNVGERRIPENLVIVSTISRPLYKGVDLILRTAKVLKEDMHLSFNWKCFGVSEAPIPEKITGIRPNDVNVKFCGVASASELITEELSATLYFHSSYIENSPNSVCEAQMLGLPVICTNVGGTSSLVQDGVDGFLVPANDPYQSAYLISKLYSDMDLNMEIGSNARATANRRHNKDVVLNQLRMVYDKLAER